MPIVDHNHLPEVPWRPNYRKWNITQEGDGTTSSDAAISEIGVGVGAPLHAHAADELIVILEGTLEVRLGDEVHTVGPNHTLVIPPDAPHGFTNVGEGDAKIISFYPVQDPFAKTRYLEGQPPVAHRH